jgi:hypothetical protein
MSPLPLKLKALADIANPGISRGCPMLPSTIRKRLIRTASWNEPLGSFCQIFLNYLSRRIKYAINDMDNSLHLLEQTSGNKNKTYTGDR